MSARGELKTLIGAMAHVRKACSAPDYICSGGYRDQIVGGCVLRLPCSDCAREARKDPQPVVLPEIYHKL